MSRTGRCLCGAVRFTAEEIGNFGVCHCDQCRRWQGSALFGVTVPQAALRIEGAEHIRSYRSSAWASRCSCAVCGSGLWYRFDKGEDGGGDYEVALGLFDDANGFVLKREIFIDSKPDSFALEGTHERLTKAEVMALYNTTAGGA